MADTPAVDREALMRVVVDSFIEGEQPAEVVERILRSGILRDAREVQHEHGERIAKAVSELPLSRRVDAGRWSYTPAEIRENAARKALDLSPAPEDPRLYDPANDGALDAQMEADTDG